MIEIGKWVSVKDLRSNALCKNVFIGQLPNKQSQLQWNHAVNLS